MVTVRLFAAARAAVGHGMLEVAPESDTVSGVVAALQRVPDAVPEVADILGRCSFLVDGRATRDPGAAVPAGAKVDVLPPFAGG
ncbi:MoaD/ThiS family protein [Agromyces seonyuensis]|nr:MoaD/ThiS family protein [Agromyces seonyuensis]